MNLGIENRVALVTGGDSGIGLATARRLLDEGVLVALTDLDPAALEAAKLDLGNVMIFPADLRSNDQVLAMYRSVSEALGAPDILVCAAGITGAQGDFLEVDDGGWEDTIQSNLMSAVRCCRAAIPSMRESGWGRVVLLSSEDAIQPYVEELAYCATKAAILNLTKGLSKAYGAEGVLVNSVSPAFIATPMTDKMMEKRAKENGTTFDRAIESFLREERPGMTQGRRGSADEVAATIAFLCSEPASFVNGANIRVDSGSVMTMAG